VYAVAAHKGEIGMSSRFLRPVVRPSIISSEEDTVQILLDLAKDIGRPAVLFPIGDATVLPVSRHRTLLAEHYRFLMPEEDVVQRLLSKDGLTRVLQESVVLGPRSLTILEPGDLNRSASGVRYPVIIKPIYSASWYRAEMVQQIGYRKVILVNDSNELRHWFDLIAQVDPRVILQEFIPGEDSRLYYVCGYYGADGRLEAIFAGQKLRITPVHFGSASFVSSIRDERLFEATDNLLRPLRYRGLFGVEFKLDPRDHEYKVIEVNVRWGLWDGLARRCGIDLGFLAYAREVGWPYKVDPNYRVGVKWLSLRRDLEAFLDYRREGTLSLARWVGSLIGPKERATFAWDDPLPGLAELRAIVREKLGVVMTRLRRAFAH
jgi:predicted ATP-grasp superfamily ATP-dependent carboligase